MKRCKKCLMAITKPCLILDYQGMCQICRHYEMRASMDYNQRFEQPRTLTSKFKRANNYYDCVGYSDEELWNRVDRFWSRSLLSKKAGYWAPKPVIIESLI